MFVIQKSEAPKPLNIRNRGSKWRDLFESMRPNEWVRVPKEGRARAAAAACTYMRGRYSMYRIDNVTGDYCLLKLR
tara:strand:- start:347 stop:574 length:228 start_codon:yes stop_codon:yes gene_type:complete